MLLRLFLIGCFFSVFLHSATGQDEEVGGFYFGPKIGGTLGTQNWDGFERRSMINYHGAVFIESIDPEFKGSFFAQLGYHSRGSGWTGATNFVVSNRSFVFRNLSLMVGAKKRLLTKTLKTPYYFLGGRVEYQLSNNLRDIQNRTAFPIFFPFPENVNKVTYGISFGGGIEFLGSDYVHPALELTISPDLSFQYQAGAIPNVLNPYTGQPVTLPERSIRNVTVELSLVIRFMRRIVYIN